MTRDDQTTHFGYREVPVKDKVRHVARVFDSVAGRYDLMNDLMSLGSHRLLKRITIEMTRLRPGQRVLDLAAGTGDLARLMAPLVGDAGRITLCDINGSMLARGRDRLIDEGLFRNLDYVIADAEALPFPGNSFHCVTIGFGLRNFTRIDRALSAIRETLTSSGRLLILEFSQPRGMPLRRAYDAYSRLWPLVGGKITGDPDSYQYLVESIRMHPDQETLSSMMQDAGFEDIRHHDFMGGIVAVHEGRRV